MLRGTPLRPLDPGQTGWLPADLHGGEGSQKFLDGLFEANPLMVLITGADGCIAGANSRALAEFGYTRDQLQGQPIEILLPVELRERHIGHRSQFRENPSVRAMGSGMNLKGRDTKGREFPVDVMLWPFAAGDLKYVMAVCNRPDVSLARSQMQVHALVESARDYAVNLLDSSGHILTWNEGARRIYNRTGSDALGQYFSFLFTPEEIAAGEPERQLQTALRSLETLRSAGWRTGVDGQRLWLETDFKAIRELNGEVSGFFRVVHDMTGHKHAEDELMQAVQAKAELAESLEKRVAERTAQLQAKVEELRIKNQEVEALAAMVTHDLAEKEVLLREVYHRVKNNLQVVQSLLKVGSRTLRSREAREAIETAVRRIHVMAMVHERLYKVPDLTGLSVTSYLRDVVEGAVRSIAEMPERVALNLDLDEFALELDLAVPFGLLANELVSNSIKHGFRDGRQGKIHISVKHIPGAVRLAIHDNGVGLPDGFNSSKHTSMGLQLAARLAHQLGGQLEFSSQDGCHVQSDLTRLTGTAKAPRVNAAIPLTDIQLPLGQTPAGKTARNRNASNLNADPSCFLS
jgi:PAS domain S-box-containing protein